MSKRILVIDDEEGIRETLKDILQLHSYDVTVLSSGEEALTHLDSNIFDIILMDYKMHGMDGVETFFKIREILPEAKVVFITAYYNEEAINDALGAGALGVCNKPLDIPSLIQMIQ